MSDPTLSGESTHSLYSPSNKALRAPAQGAALSISSPWLRVWKKIGGGSLTLSLAIHIVLLLAAGLVVVVTQSVEPQVDFLPGGGTRLGAEASNEVKHQMQQKKRSSLNKPRPMQRLVTTSIDATLSLPEAPLELLDLPDASAMIGASKLGSSGFGKAGGGGGFNSAFGSGAVQGFVGMTFFGKLGGEGMPGTFYDLKQNRDRKTTGYTDSEAAYAAIINNAANKKFADTTMKDFYQASQQMNFTFLAIPNMSANEGPKSFAVEKEVEPRAWFVHYTSTIEVPEPGDYRFVGFFDDALLVYINNRPVLDASWYPIHDHGEKRRDTEIRQDFGGPMVAPNRHAYAGRWFKFNSPARIDIVVGERPGGRVGGVLLIQNKKQRYELRADGTPILPVFAMSKPEMADMKRLTEFKNGEVPFEIATVIPVFKIRKSPFD
ncbi:hypothetical protein [Prosthecobacter dejongeii]|uniref:PA14 domain-containing protein n=1 Tax=Prosthecobacter dejongeii TaxID=48465 RepID=A0A7W7YJC7_9BACT|nr:hypothetical protein [Prosthecobacter dejongeii]MBB5037164.1 hypothetical protein [Prosthecobacter dejongeii]